jgi:tetratricopeptide (TPR) repeat protein
VELWTEAIAVYDLRVEAHQNLASLLATEGRYDEAIEVYRAGLIGLGERPATRILQEDELAERARTATEIEDRLATLFVVTERFADAEPLLRARLAREPRNVQTRSDLARALDALGREEEARAIYGTLLSEDELAETQLFNLGVALFRSSDYVRAAEAFARLTQLQPGSRDAWFNYANALFAAESWETLATAGDRLVELEPLGENAHLITARAKLESGDRGAALATLERADSVPVYLDALSMRREGTRTSVVGRVVGNLADPGSDVRVRFTFYADRGAEVGGETITLVAPAPGESADFRVSFQMRATAYRYELIG